MVRTIRLIMLVIFLLVISCIILEYMKRWVFGLVAIGVVGLTAGIAVMVASVASAAPSIEVIHTNCKSAQVVLNGLEKSDAALRINRGRVYSEVMTTFYTMNSRLSANRMSSPKLAEITTNFAKSLEKFRTDYNKYDDDLGSLISMDCQKSPLDFYDKLEKFRESRKNFNDNVQYLDQLILDYKSEFNKLVSNRNENQNNNNAQ